MKRKLSSQAIKAMTIGITVTMSSSIAISGVIKDTVVNAYATTGKHDSLVTATAINAGDGQNVKITLTSEKTLSQTLTGNLEGFKITGQDGEEITGLTGTFAETSVTINVPISQLTGKELNNLKLAYTGIGNNKLQIVVESDPTELQLGEVIITNSGNLDITAPTLEKTSTYTSEGNTITINTVTTSDKLNDDKVSIRKNVYYQTVDGLRFYGLNDNKEVSFLGNYGYTGAESGQLTGDKDKPYLVDFKNGKIVINKEGEKPVINTVNVKSTSGKTLTFTIVNSEATLSNVTTIQGNANVIAGELVNGKVKVGTEEFLFTKIGTGTALAEDFNATIDLQGSLGNVTTIAANAFSGNTATITLTLPKIENIGANAFNSANKLEVVDLGTNKVTVGEGAFAKTTTTVKSENQETIDEVINKGGADFSKVESTENILITKAVIENSAKDKIVLTLSKAPKGELNIKDEFNLNIDGEDKKNEIKEVETVGKTVTITLNNINIEKDQVVKLSYTGNKITTFSNKIITNNVGKVAPATLKSAVVEKENAKQIILTFDKAPTTPLQNKDGLTVTVENNPVEIETVATEGSVAKINLKTTTIEQGKEVKVSYTGDKVKPFDKK